MSKRPTPPYRSLTENPKWAKVQCERCGVHYWLEHGKVGKGFRYCTDECRNEPPEVRFWKSVAKDGPMHPTEPSLGCCWNSIFTPSAPYPHMKVNGVTTRAARFVLEITLKRPIAEGLQALHSCDNSRCVNPAHIFEGTQKENIKGCVARGRHIANRILTDDQVREVRALKGKMKPTEVGAIFGASAKTIYNIWLGHARANVSP